MVRSMSMTLAGAASSSNVCSLLNASSELREETDSNEQGANDSNEDGETVSKNSVIETAVTKDKATKKVSFLIT